MTTKQEQRANEVAAIRRQVVNTCDEISELVYRVPEDAHLGTQRAIRNSVHRALLDVRDFIERENARREARNG